MNGETLLFLILAFVVLGYAFSTWLEWLNLRHKSPTLPDRLRDIYGEAAYRKSLNYDRDTTRIGLLSSAISTVLIVALLLSGGFTWIDGFVQQYTTHFLWRPLLFFALLAAGAEVMGLPFSLYGTFVIEERYGFNRTTWRTFIADRLKGYLLAALIGGSLLALIIVIYHAMPQWFWLLGWALVSGFSVFFAMFYTTLIVPLFNKLSSLPEGELRSAIEDFAQKVDFPLANIYVMDSSKRSSKSNAYFSGMGKRKSIVLFDTLVEKHSTDELVAVLAHEVGHYKKKHIRQGMVLGIIQTGIMFVLLGLLLPSPAVAAALGAAEPTFHINLIAFGLLFSPVSTLLGIGMNALSRKNEFEADAFAARNFAAPPMMEALKKLSRDNLSDLEPHPWYVWVHYSHPPVMERLGRLAETVPT